MSDTKKERLRYNGKIFLEIRRGKELRLGERSIQKKYNEGNMLDMCLPVKGTKARLL